MSDKKLREKADALIAFTQQGPRFIAWVQAVTDALDPAPEKVAKVETMADRIAADLKAGTFRGEQPAPPEPAKVECPNCGEMTERSHSRYEGPGPDKWACQPAPPAPAAREMPEAVKNAWKALRKENYETFALALESWWRTHAQPVAVGMTRELRMVLLCAEMNAAKDSKEGAIESAKTTRAAISVVRAQAEAVKVAAPRPKLEKVREWLRASNKPSLTAKEEAMLAAAFAELNAAEGKGEGRG